MLPQSLLLADRVTTYRNLSAGVTGSIVKAAPGEMHRIFIANIDTKFVVVKIYNKATTPTEADTPVYTLPINTVTQTTIDMTPDPKLFSAGISVRASGAVADADTTATTASTCIIAIDYK